jgi:UDP-glucose 4-epimerase
MVLGLKYVVVMGSSGRLGRMLRTHWQAKPTLPFHPVYQSRQNHTDLIWSAQAGPQAFADSLHAQTPAAAQQDPAAPSQTVMVVLAGVTPSSQGRLDENVPITRACLQAARAAGIRRVLVASSSAVYGTDHPDLPLREDTPLTATSDYGRHKQQVEQLCTDPDWADLQISVLRIGNVAGADALMLNHAQNPAAPLDLDVFANGKSVLRSYIGPGTLAEVFQSLIIAGGALPALLNVSAPMPVYMDDLADAAGITWRARAAPVGLRQHITLDTSVLQTLHRFAPCDSSPQTQYQQMKEIGL